MHIDSKIQPLVMAIVNKRILHERLFHMKFIKPFQTINTENATCQCYYHSINFLHAGNKGFQNKSQVSIVAYRGSYTSDYFIFKFIKRAFGEFKKFNMK